MARVSSDGRFSYDGYELDLAARRLLCRYSVSGHHFVEEIRFGKGQGGTGPSSGTVAGVAGVAGATGAAVDEAAVDAAARIVYLLAGVSYYKTLAPRVVDLGRLPTTHAERRFLRSFYREGLGEFAFRNGLDLSDLEIVGPDLLVRERVRTGGEAGGPLVPFGGGLDSIVTLEHVRRSRPDVSIFVVSRPDDRFEAIERAAAVAGLPVVRAERTIDPAVSGLPAPKAPPAPAAPSATAAPAPSAGPPQAVQAEAVQAGAAPFLNGHVPVTGIISAIAVMAAVLGGHGAVVMANERSASAPTLHDDGRPVNHQWSKGLEFERGFRELLDATFEDGPTYFSFLRSRSELWVAREFAALDRYHDVFRSCNRAFALDPARRLDAWCGACDKCAFIDLVLAPYLPASRLGEVFAGNEPLCAEETVPRLRALVGTGEEPRPFECVGDEWECRVAALLAAARPDRSACAPLQRLAAEVRTAAPQLAADTGHAAALALLESDGSGYVPDALAGVDGDPAATAPAAPAPVQTPAPPPPLAPAPAPR